MATSRKSVCIVGAGPGGLVAAKTFLHTNQFDITVYEKASRIGGIWALDKTSTTGFLSPFTPTNLSRFTVGFSDLDWSSVDLDRGDQNRYSDEGKPMFPKAWMANRYLETYRKKHIPEDLIHLGREVLSAKRGERTWTVETEDGEGNRESKQFDYLIVASGFFARPRRVGQNVRGLPEATMPSPVKMIHSSEFRCLEDLLPSDGDSGNILMLGGGNSSGETAAAIATQLSNSLWSPDQKTPKWRNCKIVHVTPRPIYALPHFVEFRQGSRSYVPLDWKLYDLERRPADLASYGGSQSKEVKKMVHQAIQSMAGGDQSDISHALVAENDDSKGTAYVALSESYPEFVRGGMIEVVRARVTAIEENGNGRARATVKAGEQETTIDDISAVVYATGYSPTSALDILDDQTKAAIKYDPKSMRLPAILEQWQTMNRDAPDVSFIGFYEGPYWPMMEMQARLTAERWLTGNQLHPTRPFEEEGALLKLRQDINDRSLDVPQFWFNDYLGYLEDIASALNLRKNHQHFTGREGPISPARYTSPQTHLTQADAIVCGLYDLWAACLTEGTYVPRATFRALQGHWNITRDINSVLQSLPSGTLEGTATFHPRFPTPDKSGQTFDLEYLYIEQGTFTTTTGAVMQAHRRYVYRYVEATDELSVWFVKPEANLEVDYLFHVLGFLSPEEARESGECVAKAGHLCGADMYSTEYGFPLEGIVLRRFNMVHTVKGPRKNYTARTKLVRPEK